jgi:glycosyl transferase family 25
MDVPIYVISLRRRLDRRVAMEVSLKNRQLPFEFFDAIEPKPGVLSYWGHIFHEHAVIGEIGCYLSHLSVIKMAYDRGLAGVIIMEDDVAPMNIDARKYLSWALKCLPPCCDLLYLEYIMYDASYVKRYNYMLHHITGGIWGTGAYYITRKGMERTLRVAEEIKEDVNATKNMDMFYQRYIQVLGCCYALYPKLCYQSDSPNNISNHSTFFDRYLDIRKTVHFRYA